MRTEPVTKTGAVLPPAVLMAHAPVIYLVFETNDPAHARVTCWTHVECEAREYARVHGGAVYSYLRAADGRYGAETFLVAYGRNPFQH